jgi:hypothetical protein
MDIVEELYNEIMIQGPIPELELALELAIHQN